MKNPRRADRANVQARYDAIAKWYNAAGRFTLAHRLDAARALDIQADERVLDLACGTGINFEHLIGANPNNLLLGLDYSLGVLEQAQIRLKQNQWNRVVLGQGDAVQLPFADATFDRILCTYALKAIPLYEQAIDEVVRVLKPKGTFVAMDAALADGRTHFLNPLIRWMARGFLYEIERPLLNDIAHRFQDMQSVKYDRGYTVVIVARKE